MKKTTVYLPEDLKKKVETVAKIEKKSEADVIRDAISAAVEYTVTVPRPTLPLPGMKLSDPRVAERADELLDGFGE